MLQPIENLIPDPFMRLFCSFDAADPDTGAVLWRTGGRGKGGLPKYILIRPNESGLHIRHSDFTWEDGNRKFIRAWSLAEAIEIANQRLLKMATS